MISTALVTRSGVFGRGLGLPESFRTELGLMVVERVDLAVCCVVSGRRRAEGTSGYGSTPTACGGELNERKVISRGSR